MRIMYCAETSDREEGIEVKLSNGGKREKAASQRSGWEGGTPSKQLL
jgi:hypothetical protein